MLSNTTKAILIDRRKMVLMEKQKTPGGGQPKKPTLEGSQTVKAALDDKQTSRELPQTGSPENTVLVGKT